LTGFCVLGYWVWQYMRLRIQESFVMITVGVVFLLATIVTLAFSTILIGRVSTETSNNLLSDVKVLDFSVENIKQEALAKAEIVSLNKDLITALENNDSVSLEKTAENLLEKYQLGFLTIADNTGSVMLRAHSLSSRGDTIYGERTFDEAMLGNNVVSIDDSKGEGFSIRTGAPIFSNDKIIAVVVVGAQLDNAFADKLQKLTGLETFIYKDDVSIASSALDSDGRTRLVGEALNNDIVKKSVLGNGDIITSDSKIFGTLFHSSYAPLLNTDEKIVGMISVSKPQQDIVNIANATNRLTLITVTLIILVLSLPIYFISKKYINTDK
jgi:sensor histidine kinase regulating citrate/malate metabolism